VSQRIKLLRAALGDDPEAPRYVAGVRGHGYRLVVPVEPCTLAGAAGTVAADDPFASPAPIAATPTESSPRRVVRGPWLAALALMLGAVLWLAWSGLREPQAPSTLPGTPPLHSIAVLPFENRSQLAEDAYFVDGLHDDILTQLTRIGGLKVISRTSVERFRDSRLPVREIGEALGATHILEGAVQRSGDRVRVTVQLVDAGTDTHRWAESYDRALDAGSLFAIQSEVAQSVAAALRTRLTPAEQARVSAVPTQNLQAWEAYQVGRQALGRRTTTGLATARESFRTAIDLDPTFGRAHAGLAEAIWLEAFGANEPLEPAMREAEVSLRTALELDPDLVEALTTLAHFATMRRDFDAAEAGLRRAMEINANDATLHQRYAALQWFLGRRAESLQSQRRAVELDPMSVLQRVVLADNLQEVGRFDEALSELNRARDLDPSSPLPQRGIGLLQGYVLGRPGEGVASVRLALDVDPENLGVRRGLADLYLDLGDDERAAQLLDALPGGTPSTTPDAYLRLFRGEPAAAQAAALRAAVREPRDWRAVVLLRDAALAAGDPQAARAIYERNFPELLAEPPALDAWNYRAAVDLALVLQETGEHERAAELLRRAEAWVLTSQRLGRFGYGLADVQIRLLRGQHGEALELLREAERAGWRGPYWRYHRDFDPVMGPIRSHAEFKAVFADIERDMTRQRSELESQPGN
jgi:TolB-like protein/Tfp pilus assembly protein PilF